MLAMWDYTHKMMPGILNTVVACLWLYLRYWWNEGNFSSTRITFDRLHLCYSHISHYITSTELVQTWEVSRPFPLVGVDGNSQLDSWRRVLHLVFAVCINDARRIVKVNIYMLRLRQWEHGLLIMLTSLRDWPHTIIVLCVVTYLRHYGRVVVHR